MKGKLSKQEQRICKLLLDGDSAKDIASKLNITLHTVDFHRTNIYRKLEVQTIQELFIKYKQQDSADKDDISIEKGKKRIPILGILLGFSILVILLLLLLLLKQNPSEEKDVTQSGFNTIHLRAVRWLDENPSGNYLEQYDSYHCIRFKDVYDGDFDEFINRTKEYEGSFWSELQISGWVDKKLSRAQLDFQHIDENGKYTHLAGGLNTRFAEIGPGNFLQKCIFLKAVFRVLYLNYQKAKFLLT